MTVAERIRWLLGEVFLRWGLPALALWLTLQFNFAGRILALMPQLGQL